MKLIGKVSQYEKIVAFMKDPEGDETGLTVHDQETIARWMEAFTFLRNYNSSADASALMMKRFPHISRATAYRDLANALSLFGDISKSTKEGIRHLSTEITKDAIDMARNNNDYDAMIRGASAIAKINGVNILDPDAIDFAALAPHNFEIVLPDGVLDLLKNMVKTGRIDFSDMVNHIAEDATDATIEDE
jgi:hypothetical protein